MAKPLPGMSIPLPRGAPPPATCPRCAAAPKYPGQTGPPPKPMTWEPVPEETMTRYQANGFRPLSRCSNCWYILIEVDGEVDAK